MPTISVIIPVYNGERTILETIKSVQQQTFSDFEIIIINDGSTDRTLELVQKIEDHRIKIFSYTNGGLAASRNRGISHAKGDFIAFLDADDLWTTDKLESQLSGFKRCPEAGVAYSWARFMFEREERSYVEDSCRWEGDVYEKILICNFIHSGSNVMVRREAIQQTGWFDVTLKSVEDWDYWIRLSANWRFVHIPRPQVLYRQSSGSMSDNLPVMEKYFLIVANRAFDNAPARLKSLRSKTLSHGYHFFSQRYLGRDEISIENISKATQNLWKGTCLYPYSLFEKYTQSLLAWLLKKWVKTLFHIVSKNVNFAETRF